MPTYDILGLQVFIPDLNDLNNWIVQPITDFLNNAFNVGTQIFNNIVTAVTNAFNSAFSTLSGLAAAVSSAVVTAFQNAGATIWQSLLDTAGAISGAVGGISDAVLAFLGPAIQQITNFVSGFGQQLIDWLQTIERFFVNELKQHIGDAAEYIIRSIGSFGASISELSNAVTGTFNQLGSDIGGVAQAIYDQRELILTATHPYTLFFSPEFQQATTQALGGIWDGLQNGLLKPLQEAGMSIFATLATEFDAIFKGGSGFLSGIVSTFQSIWDAIAGFFKALVSPDKKEIFADPIGFITKTLGSVLGVFGSFGIAATAGEILQPLKNMGFTRLAAYFKDITDFQRISGDLITALQNKATLIPLEQSLNLIFRPYLPDTQTGNTWLFKGIVNTEGWRQIYAARGWSDDLIDKYYQDIWTEPSDRMIIALAETPGVPQDWIDRKVAARGYDPLDTALFKNYITMRRLSDEFNSFKTAIKNAYVKGYVDESVVKNELAKIGRSPLEIEWIIFAGQIESESKRRDEDIDIIVQAYRAGKLTDAQLLANLKGLAILEARAENIYEKELARKKVTAAVTKAAREARLSLTDILKAYDLGLLDELQTLARIQLLDYTAADASLILQIHKAAEAERAATVEGQAEITAARAKARQEESLAIGYSRYLIRAMQARLISIDTVRAEIRALPLSAGRIDLLIKEAELANATQKPLTPDALPTQLRETEIYKAWRLGLLIESQVIDYLKLVGYTDEDIALKIDINRP